MHPSADFASSENSSAETTPYAMSEESSFPCDQCNDSFSSSKDLMAHIRGADDHEAICKLCNATFTNFDNMRNHKRKVHFANSKFICDNCGMSFKTRDILKAHLDYVHKVEPDLNCNLCGRNCQNMMKLRKHTLMCLSRDPDVVAKERLKRLQFEATVSTKYQTFGYGNSDKDNTSEFGTKSPEEMDVKSIGASYNGCEAELTPLPNDHKLEENIDSINIKEEVTTSKELEFDARHMQHSIFNETYSKGDNKSEEKEELNKMDELEGLVKIETEPDIIGELLAPMKKPRKRNKIPVVAKACPICAKEVKYLYQHIRDVHSKTPETEPDQNGLVAPVKKRRKPSMIPVVAKACPICAKEVKYLYHHMKDIHSETQETELDINGLLVPVKKRKKRIRNDIPAVAKVCPICAKEVKWLSGHIKDVHTETDENHVCGDCGKVFSKRKKLRGHFDAVHKVKFSMCEICSQVFKNVHALRGHKRKVHEEVNEVACPTCFKVFETEQKLNNHEKAVHTFEDAKCQACGKTYKNKSLMLRHQKVYHKELFDAPKKYFNSFDSMKIENLGINCNPMHPQPVYPQPL